MIIEAANVVFISMGDLPMDAIRRPPVRASAGSYLPGHAERLQGHEREHHCRHHTPWGAGIVL
jgi:hypothetical protein